MNFKACTFERLAFISFGFGRGTQVGKTSLLEVNLYGTSVDVGRIHFLFGTLQDLGFHQNPRSLKEVEALFSMRRKDSETNTPRQLSGVASQQRSRPRRFDSTVKRVPKLRFEHVSFLFLVCS